MPYLDLFWKICLLFLSKNRLQFWEHQKEPKKTSATNDNALI